jgi:hypothetical protein
MSIGNRIGVRSRGCADVDCFLFRGKNAEEAKNSNHLEGLRSERGGVDELGIAPHFTVEILSDLGLMGIAILLLHTTCAVNEHGGIA